MPYICTFFHFIVKSYVHWCPTELALVLLMSGILPLSYRKQIQLCGPDILSLSYGHLSYWQRFVCYPGYHRYQFFAALILKIRNLRQFIFGQKSLLYCFDYLDRISHNTNVKSKARPLAWPKLSKQERRFTWVQSNLSNQI